MKILLIQPSQLDDRGKPIKFKKLFMPFATLPTIAGLTPADIDVRIVEDSVEDIDYDVDVDLVGLTGQTAQAPRAYQIASEFRQRGTKTIMGGIHASICPDEAAKHLDSVFVGEAEDMWAQVIDDLKCGELKPVYQADQKPDLSKLVIPRFDLINYDNYELAPFAKTPPIPIQASRGCPHNCDFCSVARFLGQKMRTKPVENVIKEIEAANPSRVFFTDDNIIGDPGYARELFTALKPLKLRWACQMSTRAVQFPGLLELAAAAGCHENFVGIETIGAENLKSVNKGFNKTEEYAELFRMCKDVGILGQASLVFGFDGDTVDSLRRTIDEVLSWDINYMYIFVLTPLPGTKFHEQMLKEGRLLDDDWSKYDCIHPVIKFKNIETNDLLQCMWDGYQKFYSKSNIWKRAWGFRREYTVHCRRNIAVEELFFQHLIHKSVKKKMHPWTMGQVE